VNINKIDNIAHDKEVAMQFLEGTNLSAIAGQVCNLESPIKKDKTVAIPLNLFYFAESGGGGEKTEKATPKKQQKARDEGQVAKSQEVSTAIMLIAGFVGLRAFSGMMMESISGLFHIHYSMFDTFGDNDFEMVYVTRHVALVFGQILLLCAPMFIVSMLVGLIMNLLQVGWNPTMKPLQPKGSKLNPLKGFKRIFGMQSLVNFIKSMFKLLLVGAVVYGMLYNRIPEIRSMLDMDFIVAVGFIGGIVTNIGIAIGVLYIFIALFDYAYTKWKHGKDLRMSKHEVKEEWKQQEGNPQIKGKIRQKMREISMRRMMQSVPQADVIITNPTHYAVALQYDMMSGMGGAPKLVAKGVDFMAKRIRESAAESNIPIVENPPLARTIYADVEVDEEIPEELYVAVAEIMAYVFKLKNQAQAS